MNCQDCGRLLYVKQTKCQCGTVATWPAETNTGVGAKRGISRRVRECLTHRLKQIGLQRYEQETDADYALRCQRHLFQHHSVTAKKLLPDDVATRLQDENECEAMAERDAIQAAG